MTREYLDRELAFARRQCEHFRNLLDGYIQPNWPAARRRAEESLNFWQGKAAYLEAAAKEASA